MMDGSSSSRHNSNSVVKDVTPMRTLAPVLPSSIGLRVSNPPTNSPAFVCMTPFGSFAAGSDAEFPRNFHPLFPTVTNPPPVEEEPLNPTPLRTKPSVTRVGVNGSGSSARKTRKLADPGSVSTEKRPRPDKPRRVSGGEAIVLPTFSSDDARESVDAVMMTFDALRRRLLQLEEAKDANRRADLRAGSIMMVNDLKVNATKSLGPVPGVEVGDIFYFRFEMLLVGLHSQSMAGIDRITAKFGNDDDTVAISIVSAGGYENEEEEDDSLIYSGQGGSSDQKLERGNLALERSLHWANGIRVIRSGKDPSCPSVKIYIYDGIYKIRESWVEKGKSGFNMFKFKLLREPGQPDGFGLWKRTQKWIENPSLRGNVIVSDLSSGSENIPVCLVNEVDNERGPGHFTYTTKVRYFVPVSAMKPLRGCMCQSVCLPGDSSCSCAQENLGDLPFSSNGLLVSRKPLIYECTSSCPCTINCRNRLTQKGIRLHFEVFKTRGRGWGLRSWDPIRAGTFICEFVGEVITKSQLENGIEEDDYVFQTLADEKPFKWNYIPELVEESSFGDSSETSGPLPIILSAKKIGNVARFMNHSCSPNVFWQPVLHDHGDEGFPHIMFFAMKHIPPMTELTYDYGNSFGARRPRNCSCRSSKCRGFFG